MRTTWSGRDHYELLEVPRDATEDEIKQGYRLQQLAWHPDRFPPGLRDLVVERAVAIQEAYELLSDPAKRRLFDATLLPEASAEEVFTDPNQRRPGVWKRMAAWMKDEDVGTPFHRRMAFAAGDLLERRRQPSAKQLKYMREAWDVAIQEGFQLDEDRSHE
jgi:DnaJ-class molecular chaperone